MVTISTICCNVTNSAVCHAPLFICFVRFSSKTILSLSWRQWIVLLKVAGCSPWSRNSRVILDKRQSSNGLSLLLSISNNVIMQACFLQGPIMWQQLVIWCHFGLPKRGQWIHVFNVETMTYQTQRQPANRHIIVFPSKNTAFIKDKTFVG